MSSRIESPAEGHPRSQHNGIADRKLAECVMHACHAPPFWLSPKLSGVSAPLHGNMTSTHIFGNFTPGLLSASIMGTSLICQSWPGCSARARATNCTCMASQRQQVKAGHLSRGKLASMSTAPTRITYWLPVMRMERPEAGWP